MIFFNSGYLYNIAKAFYSEINECFAEKMLNSEINILNLRWYIFIIYIGEKGV